MFLSSAFLPEVATYKEIAKFPRFEKKKALNIEGL
jgi:hypothetical protein